MALVRWDSIRELDSLQGEMNRLFSTSSTRRRRAAAAATAAAHAPLDPRDGPRRDAATHFVLQADLPGIGEEDVTIELENNVLTISGERKAEHEEQPRGLLPHRARDRLVLALAEPARGHRPRRRHRDVRQRRAEVRIPKPVQAKPRRVKIGVGGGRPGDRAAETAEARGAA